MATPDLVQQLGRELRADLPRYVQRLVPLLRVDYAPVSTAASEDLEAAVVGNLGGIVDSLAGDATDHDPFRSARATGVLRCRQGVPLELVLHAFRVGGRVLWDGMVEKGAGGRPEDPGNVALLEAAGAVWEVIDAHSSVVAASYRDEERRRQDSRARESQALVTALLEGQGQDPAFAASAAHRLGLPVAGPFVCVVLVRPADASQAEHPVRGSALHAAWSVQGPDDVGLVVVPDGSDAALQRELAPLAAAAGISPPFLALADVPTAHRLADLAVRTLGEPAPTARGALARLDDRLAQALLLVSPEVTARLRAATVEPLLGRGPYGQALLDTVEALLACDGSPAAAARLLPCHRNTVLHRLERVGALTGLGLSTNGQRLLWTLGLLSLGRDGALGTDRGT